MPAIYAVADICRPELLVEIEGVAFSHYIPPALPAGKTGSSPQHLFLVLLLLLFLFLVLVLVLLDHQQ